MKIPESVSWRSTGTTLGRGGQGEVHLVTRNDQTDGPKYALKVLRNAGSQQARQRFCREIEALKQIQSPEIINVFDHSNEDDSFQFYVMEYHEKARTLSSIIFSEANPYHGNAIKCIGLFEQIVSAIRVCQVATHPIVHRDINPKNILVLPDKTIRVIDFGICQVQDGTMITLVDENVGARNYTSPECESGNDESIGVWSDIYSASKVLWSAITSKQAFARETPAFKERSMACMFPAKPETWHLAHIFAKTIRQSPSDRVQSTMETFRLAREVRSLIDRGMPPLQALSPKCPSCGLTEVREYRDGYKVFGNPNPPGVVSLICNACGIGFVRDIEKLRKSIERLQSLT